MTSKQIYEATAIELSKVQAPALKLYEFNYFFNQAIRQFVNKVYNVYDVNQLTTDDLRVLKATATLTPSLAPTSGNAAVDYLRGATYYVDMPDDYLHLLNCICLFNVNKRKDCWNKGDVMVVGAKKLTADSWSSVIDDVYNLPTKKQPYYYIHNQNDIVYNTVGATAISGDITFDSDTTNKSLDNPTGYLVGGTKTTIKDDSGKDVDVIQNGLIQLKGAYKSSATPPSSFSLALPTNKETDSLEIAEFKRDPTTGEIVFDNGEPSVISKSGFDRTFKVNLDLDEDGNNDEYSTVEKPAGTRHANSSRVKVEIRCGRDKSKIFDLSAVQIDYVKAPQFIRLTQEQLDSDEDISQIMEFPDYVNQEIVNELVNLVMRKTNDPSLSTHLLMTLSIARPTGQLQQQPAAQG